MSKIKIKLNSNLLNYSKKILNKKKLSIEIINTGINSNVYKLHTKNEKFILKIYKNKTSLKGKIKREYFFIKFLKKNNIDNIPKIYGVNYKLNCILMNFIQGSKIKKIKTLNLIKAAQFISNINTMLNLNIPKYKYRAVDSCFTIKDHVDLVDKKINKLAEIKCKNNGLQNSLSTFIEKYL